MKIKNYLTILFAVIAIIFLLFLAGYMTYINADDSNPFKQTVTNLIEEANLTFGLGLDLEKVSHPTLPALSDITDKLPDSIPFISGSDSEESTSSEVAAPSDAAKQTEAVGPAETTTEKQNGAESESPVEKETMESKAAA